MELREDPFTGALVAIAPQRHAVGSPQRMLPAALPEVPREACPFCPGHESETEATLEQVPETGPWSARVVANRYPLVGAGTGLAGAHEVVVDHPDHAADWPDFGDAHAAALFALYRRRALALAALAGTAHVVFFRNRGRRAGSSQPHPHAQLVALGVVPPDVALRDARAAEHHARTGETLLATVVRAALEERTRVVHEDADVVVLCPATPHRVHEVWVVPRRARGAFTSADDDDDALGRALARTTAALARVTDDADSNVVVRTPPARSERSAHASFHVEVCPRTIGGAGFELATAIDVVTVPPDVSAARLRAAW